ncbi:hypothetical protein [Burkholderia multivorans]|uniref:hypothetical protein n=1 Tax=Burkholderia multivorans TaxID=87883 RepID=UPI0021C0006E|nr:hypothetical protein [Burkholderia multivorans]
MQGLLQLMLIIVGDSCSTVEICSGEGAFSMIVDVSARSCRQAENVAGLDDLHRQSFYRRRTVTIASTSRRAEDSSHNLPIERRAQRATRDGLFVVGHASGPLRRRANSHPRTRFDPIFMHASTPLFMRSALTSAAAIVRRFCAIDDTDSRTKISHFCVYQADESRF